MVCGEGGARPQAEPGLDNHILYLSYYCLRFRNDILP